MVKPKVICIDLDGVLVDMHTDLARLFGDDPETYTQKEWAEIGEWGLSIPSVDGKFSSPDDFWDKVRAKGAQWWIDLPKLPWADELWNTAKETGATCVVLTTPAPFPECAYGKWQWVHENLHTENIFIARPKNICSKEGTWLIDDRAALYGKTWEDLGGRFISLKREWNPTGRSIEEILTLLREG